MTDMGGKQTLAHQPQWVVRIAPDELVDLTQSVGEPLNFGRWKWPEAEASTP